MAELAFKVKADYEQATKLSEELGRLRSELAKVDTSTEEGKKHMEQLTAKYEETKKQLNELAVAAAQAAYYMSNEFRTKMAASKAEVLAFSEALVHAQASLAHMTLNPNGKQYSKEEMESAKARIEELSQKLLDAEKRLRELGKAGEDAGSDIDKGFKGATPAVDALTKRFIQMAGAYVGLGTIKRLGQQIFQVRQQFEDAESTMVTFLGTAEEGKRYFNELKNYAFYNMFGFDELQAASTQLIAYKNETKDLIPIIDQLSNVASGTGKSLLQYVGMWNKAKSVGKVDGRDMQSWASAGLELRSTLEGLGETVNGNSISFDQLKKAISAATAEGGQFFGTMANKMTNLSSAYAQLQDTWKNKLNEMGEDADSIFRKIIKLLTWGAEHFDGIFKAIIGVATALGTAKAAGAAWNIISTLMGKSVQQLTLGFIANAVGINGATVAVKGLNTAMKANVIIAVASAVLGLGAALLSLRKRTNDATESTGALSDAQKEEIGNMQKDAAEMKALFDIVKDETKSKEERRVAIQKLNTDYPEYIKNVITEKTAANELADAYQRALEKMIAVQRERMREKTGQTENSQNLQSAKDNILGMFDVAEANRGEVSFDEKKLSTILRGRYLTLLNDAVTSYVQNETKDPELIDNLLDTIVSDEDYQKLQAERNKRLFSISSFSRNDTSDEYKRGLERYSEAENKKDQKQISLLKDNLLQQADAFRESNQLMQEWETAVRDSLKDYNDPNKKITYVADSKSLREQINATKAEIKRIQSQDTNSEDDGKRIKALQEEVKRLETQGNLLSDIKKLKTDIKKLQSQGEMSAEDYKELQKLQQDLKNKESDYAQVTGYKPGEREQQWFNRRQTQAQNARAFARQVKDSEFAISKARIDAMEAGAAKELATMNLNHRKEVEQFRRQREDMVKKLNEEARNEWVSADSQNRKGYQFADVYKLDDNGNIVSTSAFEQKTGRYKTLQEWIKNQGVLEGLEAEQFSKSLDEYYAKYGPRSEQRKNLIEKQRKILEDIVAQREQLGDARTDFLLDKTDKQNALDLAKFDEGTLGGNATREQEIAARRRVIQAEANLIEDENQRALALARGNAELTKMRYGTEYGEMFYEDAIKAATENYEAEKKILLLRHDMVGLMKLEKQYAQEITDIEMSNDYDLALAFGDVSRYTKEQLERAREALNLYKQSAAYQNADVETIDRIRQAEDNLDVAERDFPFRRGEASIEALLKNRRERERLKARGERLQNEYQDYNFAGLQELLAEAEAEAVEAEEQGKDTAEIAKRIADLRRRINNLSLDPKMRARKEGLEGEIEDNNDKSDQNELDAKLIKIALAADLASTGVADLASHLSEIAEITEDDSLAGLAEGLSSMANIAGQIATGNYGGAITSGVGEIWKIITNGVAETEEMKRNGEDFARAMQLAALAVDEADYSNIFGTNRSALMSAYGKSARDAMKAYRDAMNSFGNQGVSDNEWWNGWGLNMFGVAGTAGYAAIQNGVSSQFQAYQDAIAKGYKGLETMLIKTREQTGLAKFFGAQDEYTALGQLAPGIIDEEGLLDVDKAKAFLDTNTQISDEQRRQIENAIELKEAYDSAEDSVKSMLSNLMGSTASDLADATLNGLRTGAALGSEQMKTILGGTAKDLQKQMVESIYASAMQKYSDEMLDKIKKGGTETDVLDIYARMLDEMEGTVGVATRAAEHFEEYAEARGFNMRTLANADTGAQAYQTISESTGSSLDGRLASIQISQGVRDQQMGIITTNFAELNQKYSQSVDIASDIRNMMAATYISVERIRTNLGGDEKNTIYSAINEIRSTVNDIKRTL